MASAGQWISAARPRTLPAAVAPVLVGVGAAALLAPIDTWFVVAAALAMTVALALQIGVNYANDYSDGIRGTDTARVGPFRLVGSGAAEPRHVKRAALACFAIAAAAGLVLAAVVAWWLLLVGAAAIAAAWFYTGGRRPYGYAGFGEVFVFVFFGLVATAGTTFVIAGRISVVAVILAVGVGLLACAILVANNLRDIPGDRLSGKRTLAVRIGDRATRHLYVALVAGALIAVPVAALWQPWCLWGLVAAPLALRPVRAVLRGTTGGGLIPVLAATGMLETVYALALMAGMFAAR